MAKTVLQKEQYDLLIRTYNEKGTYAAAARVVGISSSVATRIIKEFLESGVSLEEEPQEILAYSGPQPKENPEYNDIYYCLWNSEEWCDLI